MSTLFRHAATLASSVLLASTAHAGTFLPLVVDAPTEIFQGVPATFTITSGPTGGRSALFVSVAAPSRPLFCPSELGGGCFDLRRTAYLADFISLSGPGPDVFTVTAPHNPAIRSAKFQAAALFGTSTWMSDLFDLPVIPTCVAPSGSVPASGAVDVAVDAALAVTFDDPIAPYVTAVLSQGGAPVDATVSGFGTDLTVTPDAALATDTVYTLTVTDLCGTDTVVTFTTVAGGDPCGNGILDPGEACDTTTTATCGDYDLRDGAPVCDSSCQIDTTPCSRPALVDIAMYERSGACTLDAVGQLRCEPAIPTDTTELAVDPGPFTDIAASEDFLCALRPDATITCWTSSEAPVSSPLPSGAVPSFGQDDFDGIYLHDAAGTTTWAVSPTGPLGVSFLRFDGVAEVDFNDVDLSALTGNMAVRFVDGHVSTYYGSLGTIDGSGVVTLPPPSVTAPGPYVDVATNGTVYPMCAIRPDATTVCIDASGAEVDGALPPTASSMVGVGSAVLVFASPGDPRLVVRDLPASDPLPLGVRAVAASPLGESSAGPVCWITADGNADCGATGPTAITGRAPEGDDWTDVELGLNFALWTDDLGRAWDVEAYGSPDLTLVDDLRPVGISGAMCGLAVDGHLVCTGGSHLMQIPDEALVDWAVGNSYGVDHALCGIRAVDGSLVCTSHGAVLDSPPAGVFVDVDVETAPFYQDTAPTWAVGVRSDGTLACWGDAASCALVPAGNDYVHVDIGTYASYALHDDGTLSQWTPFSTVPVTIPSAVYDRYLENVGINDDGSIGYWSDPTRPAPAGPFDVVIPFVSALAEGSDFPDCGLRPNGTISCWSTDGGVITFRPDLPGTYTGLAGGNGLMLTLDDQGRTRALTSFTPPEPAHGITISGYGVCYLDAANQLQCIGNTQDDFAGAPIGSVVDRVDGAESSFFGTERFCAIGPSTTTCFGGGFAFNPPAIDAVGVDFDSYEGMCWIERTTGAVDCDGGDHTPWSPYTPPASQAGLPTTSVATSYGASCRVRNDAILECWGVPSWGTPPSPTLPVAEVHGAGLAFTLRFTDGTLQAFEPFVYRPVFAPSGTFTTVDGLFQQWCGVRTDGTGTCWTRTLGEVRTH